MREHTFILTTPTKQGAFVLTSKVEGHSHESSGKLVFYLYGQIFPGPGLGFSQGH